MNHLYPEQHSANDNLAEFGKYLEVYFRDIPHTMKRIATEETTKFVTSKMSHVKWVDSRWQVLDLAMKSIKERDGLWIELGMYSGQTINYIAERNPDIKILGLDSFQGLPENWRPEYQKGEFSLKKIPNVCKNVEVHAGWFSDTLPEILKNDRRGLSFLHIDCDLYSSTKAAFDLLSERINPGTVFVFDEFFNYPGWKKHEYKAFNELITSKKLKFKYLTYTRNHSQCAILFT